MEGYICDSHLFVLNAAEQFFMGGVEGLLLPRVFCHKVQFIPMWTWSFAYSPPLASICINTCVSTGKTTPALKEPAGLGIYSF